MGSLWVLHVDSGDTLCLLLLIRIPKVVGKTTSSVNIVGEMKSDTVDLDTHTGLSIILGLRPEGKEISVKVPKTVDELIEIMTPYKNSDKTLLIDCGGFDSDLTRTAIAFADCVIVPSKDSLTERIGLMHFDGVLDEISSIMGTDITAHLYLCKVNPNKKKFLSLMQSCHRSNI